MVSVAETSVSRGLVFAQPINLPCKIKFKEVKMGRAKGAYLWALENMSQNKQRNKQALKSKPKQAVYDTVSVKRDIVVHG